MNRLHQLEKFGQSIWLDNLSRALLRTGGLKKLIDEDGVKGVTSNPSIFEKAIGHSDDYDDAIADLLKRGSPDAGVIFRALAVKDIQDAADTLRGVYDATSGADGFVSMEVSPYIAMDTDATIAEARSLWHAVGRDNLMIKVPATKAGVPAIEVLIGDGINVNITLLFARDMYEAVANAYLKGLETLARKRDLKKIASVASFFVSRIDSLADKEIEAKLKTVQGEDTARLKGLLGKTAIANAKLAYEQYKRLFSGARWDALATKGARSQRLLWASTSTKNKAYRDVMYVETLIGQATVNTIPPETLDAFRDHGEAASTLETHIDEAKQVLADLEREGISLDKITDALVDDGVAKFADAADKLYGAIAAKREKILGSRLVQMSLSLGDAKSDVDDVFADWTRDGKIRALWAKDKALWTNADEDKWLGWLDIVEREFADPQIFEEFASWVKRENFTDVVLLGMGGSSLGAEVFAECFGPKAGAPKLHVLDSTDPDQIRALESAVDIVRTLFIVSSKSGSTLEPNILKDYFRSKSHRFVAITDPGSSLEAAAKKEDFSRTFLGDPAIGGRYSVLSKFGLIPAAAMGLDVKRLLSSTQDMVASCSALTPPDNNLGVKLGATLGVLAAKHGRDKVTISASKALLSVGLWLEQLIAESTGKHGKGLIPIDNEPLAKPDVYGKDRVFVHLSLKDEVEADGLTALEKAGQPVIRLMLDDPYQLGQLFFLSEIAVAVAGAIIGINPFDQPDVEASKIETRKLTDQFEHDGKLPEEKPIASFDGVSVFARGKNAEAISNAKSLAEILRTHLKSLSSGDYFAFLAFIDHDKKHEATLQSMRMHIRDVKKVATCAEFGPRFLHSTGQAYKGGPNSGVFVTITANPVQDIDVPGRKFSFGIVEQAQALGDFAVLCERGRRCLRIHLDNAESGLAQLNAALGEALK
ncbi:MAG TPA: bifunctional transaldolase/phosoglucose isomerase [Rhizomicrobium sp.]|nr:bifunctional transaldolase/phosoglucose isomerase [Rhizomicrobium sp.]